MLRAEVRVLRALEHPNIIRLVEVFEETTVVHLVFEACRGGELFDYVANQTFRFSEREASRLTRKMLLAVKYCHDRYIVHRDMKPENMLLSERGGVDAELKVIDFGLATECLPGQLLDKHGTLRARTRAGMEAIPPPLPFRL